MSNQNITFVGNPTTDKTAFVNAWAAIVSGETITIAGSGEIDLGVNWDWTKGATIKAATTGATVPDAFYGTRPALRQKNIVIRMLSAPKTTQPLIFQDVKLGMPKNIWPDFPGANETWQSKVYTGMSGYTAVFDALAGVLNANISLIRVEGAGGYGNSQSPYVYGFRYPGSYSPASYYVKPGGGYLPDSLGRFGVVADATLTVLLGGGHGDTTPLPNQNGNYIYNDILTAPQFMRGQFASVYAEDCYIHDWSFGLVMAQSPGATGNQTAKGCIFERNWAFDIQGGPLGTDNKVSPPLVERCIFQGTLASEKDLGNPHRDFVATFQIGGAINTNNSHQGWRMHRNIFIANPGDQARATGLRNQAVNGAEGPGDQPTVRGPQMYWNMSIGAGAFEYDNCIEDFDGVGNIISPVLHFTPTYGHINGETNKIHFYRLRSWPRDTVGRVEGNIADAILYDTSPRNTGNVLLGNVTTTEPAAAQAVLANPTGACSTLADWFNNYKPKAGAVPADVAFPFASVDDMLDPAIDAIANIPPHAQPIRSSGVTAGGAKVVSQVALKHGGDWGQGDTITPGPGLEWQEVDWDGVTVLQPWSSAPGTIHTGKHLQLRHDPPAVAGTSIQPSYTIGSRSFVWSIAAKSNNTLAAANVNGVQLRNLVGLKDDTDTLIANAPGFSGFAIFKYPVDPSGPYFFQASTSTASDPFTSSHILTQATATQFNINANPNTAQTLDNGAQFTSGATNVNAAANVVMIAWSMDFANATENSARRFFLSVNGGAWVDISTSYFGHPWHEPGNPVTMARVWQLFSAISGTHQLNAVLYLMGITHQVIDWSGNSNANLNKLGTTCGDVIGPRGQGVTPDGSPMLIFGDGNAARINAGTFNLNTHNPFSLLAGTAVDQAIANAATPGTKLTLLPQVLTANPKVGSPVDVLVTFSGLNAQTVLTPTWGGVSRSAADGAKTAPEVSNGMIFSATPTAVGNLTFDLANDQNHTNPAQLVIPIVRTIPFTILPGPGRSGTPLETSVTIHA